MHLILFDMETGDPDDFLTLCFLISHPNVNLKAVTLTPGTKEQVGLVNTVFERTGIRLPIGAYNPDHDKHCVSTFHNKVLGEIVPTEPDGLGGDIIHSIIQEFPNTIIVGGAPLYNLSEFLTKYPESQIKRCVLQGGFAGDNIVSEEHRLNKFKGMEFCPTFNFDGGSKQAWNVLRSSQILQRDLVSKNVTHGLKYTKTEHQHLAGIPDKSPGMQLFYETMDVYLKKNSYKRLHDPLAACCAINRSICQFKEVEIVRQSKKWGSFESAEPTNTFISIVVDQEAFFRTLFE